MRSLTIDPSTLNEGRHEFREEIVYVASLLSASGSQLAKRFMLSLSRLLVMGQLTDLTVSLSDAVHQSAPLFNVCSPNVEAQLLDEGACKLTISQD